MRYDWTEKAQEFVEQSLNVAQENAEKIIEEVDELAEEELTEGTDLYNKNGIQTTRFAMGKGKGMGLQVNYGMKYIQVPEKDIKALQNAVATSLKNFRKGL